MLVMLSVMSSVAVFNVGDYRRNMKGCETIGADFYHPTNDEARHIRELVDLVIVAVNCTFFFVCICFNYNLYLILPNS